MISTNLIGHENIMDEALSSRNASVNIIREVIIREQPLELAESKILPSLNERERKLSRAITATTLRHIGEISYLIDKFMKHPFDNDSLEKNIMRIGIAQLLFMDSIPAHAAIHGAVELAKVRGKVRATGIINAILRRTQREGLTALEKTNAPKLNIPNWIQQKIINDYGPVRSEAIFEYMLKISKIDLRMRDQDIIENEDIQELIYNIPIHTETFRLKQKHIAITDIPGWDDGKMYVQDAAAQIPARLFNNLNTEGDILDMCAAPGGKTIQLIDAHKDRKITAIDLSQKRIARVHENFKRCQVSATVVCGDASKTGFDDQSFAGILIDAPCSATGTSRRHPDVLITRKPEHVRNLTVIQENILNEAARLLKVNGIMVYATCSLFHEEGEKQIESFLKNHANFEVVPVTLDEVGGNEYIINDQGEVRTTPAENMDGFFAARLRKNA
ncbi:MAG: 16S rRNA (cytosine967-C5)-methyltransferase [Alphaproteobacteria bacterium]|jgi:16S rRNA (cytosine967-C5)-methyltransferase